MQAAETGVRNAEAVLASARAAFAARAGDLRNAGLWQYYGNDARLLQQFVPGDMTLSERLASVLSRQ